MWILWSLLSCIVILILYVLIFMINWKYDWFFIYYFISNTLHSIIFRYKRKTTIDIFEDAVDSNSNELALVFEEQTFTYYEMECHANQVANWAISIGIKSGDIIGLCMCNCPEFLFIWIGLAKVGVTIALINTRLTGLSLSHVLELCKLRFLIVNDEFIHLLSTNRDDILQHTEKCFIIPFNDNSEHLIYDEEKKYKKISYLNFWPKEENEENNNILSINRPDHSLRSNITSNDLIFLILTSGTTGLPKAAKVTHIRFFIAGLWWKTLYKINKLDRIYNCLPLYHSNSGMICSSMAWQSNSCVVLARKFSASTFFEQCEKQSCTVMFYIGEICRYLLASKPTSFDKTHIVKKAIGNGMNPDIWLPFCQRFDIPYIGEFYASSEGNVNLMNPNMKVGSIGYIPSIAIKLGLYPIHLVQLEEDQCTIVRDKKTKNATLVKQGEPGELIGKIGNFDPLRNFDGYTDKSDTQHKIITNPFGGSCCCLSSQKRDYWFCSGDLLKQDEDGFYYFIDRLGDSFRFKGENISASQIEGIALKFEGIKECVCYGVEVPYTEGRVGMLAFVVDDHHDEILDDNKEEKVKESSKLNLHLLHLLQHFELHLPREALPVFLRMKNSSLDLTVTFKYSKRRLKRDGFSINNDENDPIYILSQLEKKYIPLTEIIFTKVNTHGLSKI